MKTWRSLPLGANFVKKKMFSVFAVGGLTYERLEEAFTYCLTEEARTTARECYRRAVRTAEAVKHEFISFVREPASRSTEEDSKAILEIAAPALNSMTTSAQNPTASSSLTLPVNLPSISGIRETEVLGPTALILLYHRVTEA